ncbi:MAG TPA: ABC transporter substrate-binding protein [Actinomycetota bacterium]|jgi:osmoprotectant transport system substrate-binding protein|nr:ABC transporter substrate-binding protein [Actinomycetota bacterium]
MRVSIVSRAAALALAALLAAGCGAGTARPAAPEDPRRPTVTVASFDFPESEILAEIYAQALRRHGYPAEVVARLGSREIVQPALEQGKVDLVPEYLGTALDFLNGGERLATADARLSFKLLQRAFAVRGVTVLAYAPVEDRNGYVVTSSTARERRLRRLSDLLPLAYRLTFGGPPECPARPLCLKGLQDLYGLRFASFEPMPSRAVTAAALVAGEIDIGMIETTNGSLATNDLVQLEDDLRLQPAENIVPAVRTPILNAYGAPLARLLNRVTRSLTVRELIEMNRRVELEQEQPRSVAAAWLRDHRFA